MYINLISTETSSHHLDIWAKSYDHLVEAIGDVGGYVTTKKYPHIVP